MARQANGQYVQPANTSAVSAQTISSSAFNTLITDVGTEITNSVDRAGRSAMTADLSMGTHKLTNVVDPVAATDAATKNYVDTAAALAPLPNPQGYLTPTAGTKVITADVIAAPIIYYTPDAGLWNPIHNGTAIVAYKLAGELPLTLTASQSASGIYDIFLAYNGGTPVIGTGPSWVAGAGGSVTAGSCARGTGAGGTALARLGGIYTNAATISLIWNTGGGNTTLSVPVNQGIYLGSIFIDAVAGQITCHRSYGQSRKWGIWNAYNRAPIILKAGDSTVSWNYSSNVQRGSNGSTANIATVFQGLAEEQIESSFKQNIITNGLNRSAQISIGWNSYTIASGFSPLTIDTAGSIETSVIAEFIQTPSLGINNVTCQEASPSNSSAVTFFGIEGSMLLTARWRG